MTPEAIGLMLAPSHNHTTRRTVYRTDQAYFRAGRVTWVLCCCPDCQVAHKRAQAFGIGLPFHAGQPVMVCRPDTLTAEPAIVTVPGREKSGLYIYRPDEPDPVKRWSAAAADNAMLRPIAEVLS